MAGVGAGVGIIFGIGNGIIAGDRGAQLLTDAVAGGATGGLIGLTDGFSLLGGISARAALSTGIEFDRQAINGDIDGCQKISAKNLIIAGSFSVLGDLAGSLVSQTAAIDAAASLHYIPEIEDSIGSVSLGGITAGAAQIPFSALDSANDESERELARLGIAR